MENELDRYSVKIRTILEIDAKTIHEELTTALGPNARSYRTVVRWSSRFRGGRDVNDDPRSGPPVSELTDENIELVRQISNNDPPRSTYDEIIAETSLSLSCYNRTSYPRLSQDEKNDIWFGT